MTRFLSQALQAAEPGFRQGIQRLEAANGNPSADIRFTMEIRQMTRQKILELGLDPDDTTPKELYRALEQRIINDDRRLMRKLQTESATHISAEADVVAGMVHVLKNLPESRRSYALKASVLKSLLRKQPPKKAMKALGYRSFDSFVKHEQPVLILTAAWLTEGAGWQKRLLEQYRKLTPKDFERRNIILSRPESSRWHKLAAGIVEQNQHNIIAFKEFGALVFLPLPSQVPAGVVTASTALALHELNEIRAAGTYLQLCQVKAGFGEAVKTIATRQPYLKSQLLDQPVPWHIIQRYYSRLKDRVDQAVFEPHLQLEDMVWHSVERTLSKLEPAFSFWQQSSHLAMLDGRYPVSFNLVDAALNACNRLSYEQRAVHYFQQSVWHELLLKYLKHEPVEASVLAELQPQLAAEKVLA